MRFWKRDEKRKMVRVYDPDTGGITSIPAAELAPGMVSITIQGMEGEFWADASKLQQSAYRHPPFEEEVREIFRGFQQALQEVYPLSLEQWEDGFRRDAHPEREIAYWLHLSRVYTQAVGDRPLSLEHKQDIFRVLISCLNNPREMVMTVVDLQVMSRQEAEALVELFYNPDAGNDGVMR